MSTMLGLEDMGDGMDAAGGVEVWLIDARRPWNLGNVFGGDPNLIPGGVDGNAFARAAQVQKGMIQPSYKPGQGGIIVYDDGDIEQELVEEREAYCALLEMPDVEDHYELSESDLNDNGVVIESIENKHPNGRKRKSWSCDESEEGDEDNSRPRQRRRRSSSVV